MVSGRRGFLAGSAALGLFTALPPVHAQTAACKNSKGSSWIPDDAFLAELARMMQAFAVPGVGIAVVEDGAVAWSRGIGIANAQTQAPIAARTVFEDASLSKPVFAYLVMQLVEQGSGDAAGGAGTDGVGCPVVAIPAPGLSR